MLEIQNYISFVLATLIFQVVPGAGTIAILNATARSGRRVGMASVAGTLVGDFILMVAAVAGLAAVLRANPVLFQVLQWFGAAYLCWLGCQLLRARIDTDKEAQAPWLSPWLYFWQACAVSLTNPKTILFFMSFFPLFLKPEASWSTLSVMMLHVTLISLAYQTGLVVVGNTIALQVRSLPSARMVATRLAGIALLGFGIKIATSNQ